MSQFQNEAFQFDFVKTLVQTLSQSVAMITDLSFYVQIVTYSRKFYVQIVTYSRKFYFVKINFICSQVTLVLTSL